MLDNRFMLFQALAETAEEKRLRLAKAYLEEITKVEQERAEDK